MKQKNPVIMMAVLVTALAAALAAGTIVRKTSRDQAIDAAFNRLTLFHGLRKASIEDYMLSKASDMRAMSRNARVIDALEKFEGAWSELGDGAAETVRRLYIDDNPFRAGKKRVLRSAGDDSRYTETHRGFHDWAQRFNGHFGFHDLFLIDRNGNIVYSVEKESDFATNLALGPYRDTPLGLVYRKSAKQGGRDVNFSDFERYGPSNDAPAAFASAPMLDRDGDIAGVFAVQLREQPTSDLLRSAGAMGETGQTYIVGNDMLMRSQSRFADKPTMLSTEVDTKSVVEGLKGFSGARIISDYRGRPVLSVYSPLDFGGPLWVLLAEVELSDALRKLRLWPALLAGLVAGLLAGAAAFMVCRMILGNRADVTSAPPAPSQAG